MQRDSYGDFHQLPDRIKNQLAIHLDCDLGANWKRLAEALNCPCPNILAYEERASHRREGSPSLVFFDQFCASINIVTFRDACNQIQNLPCVSLLNEFLKNFRSSFPNSSLESCCESVTFLSLECDRLHDFDHTDTPSRESSGKSRCISKTPLSQAIYRNVCKTSCTSRKCESCCSACESGSMLPKSLKDNQDYASKEIKSDSKITDRNINSRTVSVFITYSCNKEDLIVVRNLCRFLIKNQVSVSLDTNNKTVKNIPTEDWIKQKFVSVDYVLVLITPGYKEMAQSKKKITCFQIRSQKIDSGYHAALIHDLMLKEHMSNKSGFCSTKETKSSSSSNSGSSEKKESSSPKARFISLLARKSSSKDVPKWLRSYPMFIWPDEYTSLMCSMVAT